MSPARSFQEKSYQRHSEHYKQYSIGGKNELHAKTLFENDSVDAWRHQRMYQVLDPILISDPKAKWLTVGDGRFGRDAKYIKAIWKGIWSHILANHAGYVGFAQGI